MGGWDGDKLLDTVYVYGEPGENSGKYDASDAAQTSAGTARSAVEPECETEDWHTLAAMAAPAADFSVVSDRSFGTLVLRSCKQTNEVLVEPLRAPVMSLHQQQEVARAVAAQDDADTGAGPALTAAGKLRGSATVGCSTVPSSEEARGAFQIMRRLSHPENLPVKLQNCVAACGLPSAAEAAPTAEDIAARRATVNAIRA